MSAAHETSAVGYEARDASVGWILASAGLLALGIVLSFAAAGLLYLPAHRAKTSAGPEMFFQHGADEESGIARDWKTQDTAVRQHLDNYAWVDRGAGLVQIPLERAIELTVQDPAAPPKNSQ